MKPGTVITIVGGIISILGTVFHFQGHSVIGPESSFMYSNPDWITYGLQIMFIGIGIITSGIIIQVVRRS